jgi:hypothetical protein
MTLEGLYKNGKVELVGVLDKQFEDTPVLVTFLAESTVANTIHMAQNRFIVYFYLPSHTLSLIEIKRQDLGEISDPGKLFHWLLLDHQTQTLEKLEFRAMNSQPPEEAREFAQGSLQFNQSSGSFQANANGQTHTLQVLPVAQVPESLLALVNHYLDGCS